MGLDDILYPVVCFADHFPIIEYKEPLRFFYCRLCSCLFVMTKPFISNTPTPPRQRRTVRLGLVWQSHWIQSPNRAGSPLSEHRPDPPPVSKVPWHGADNDLRVGYVLPDFFHYLIRRR